MLNEYANFATVIDTGTNAVNGEFEAGFFAEKAVFNKDGTRLYITERANPANGADGPNGRVHAFSVGPGPSFITRVGRRKSPPRFELAS